MRMATAAAVLLAGCALHRLPTAAPSHPNETHVLAMTQEFAARLGVKVQGVITVRPRMVPAIAPLYPGEKVPAAGWYSNGRAEYFRWVIRDHDRDCGTALVAHEVSHAIWVSEAGADACARLLVAGEGCPR